MDSKKTREMYDAFDAVRDLTYELDRDGGRHGLAARFLLQSVERSVMEVDTIDDCIRMAERGITILKEMKTIAEKEDAVKGKTHLDPGTKIIISHNRDYPVTVSSANNYGQDGKDDWYIEGTFSDSGNQCYWKQSIDGGTVRLA